jgi:hypothetical protein
MKHKKIETTMRVYVQVNSKELEDSAPSRYTQSQMIDNVIPLRKSTIENLSS